MATGVDLSISGLASGFDWKTVVSQLAQAERAPETLWTQNQTKIKAKNSAFTIISSYLNQIQVAAKALKDSSVYEGRSATSSATDVATASVSAGAKAGSYKFTINQLATTASIAGTANAGAHISATNDVSGVTVGTANFATAITAGNFTVNGKQIKVETTDSLQKIFTNISTATGGAVTASYDASTDKISFNSASNIVLGSAADTSNFLQATKLYNNGTGSISSADTLGRVQTSNVVASAKLAAAVTDGPNSHVSSTNDVSGVTMSTAHFGTAVTAGTFTVNGSQVTFAGTDSLQDVFDKISTATSGKVTASYNASTDRITLVNSDSHDTTAITLGNSSDTSNFLTAAKLTANGSTSVSSSDTVGSGAGKFTINGVAIAFNALKDTMQDVIGRINNSGAGVTASYDVVNNKFSMVNNTTGDVGVSMSDDTGNFLAATGLLGGTLTAGKNLKYTVNDGVELVSQSNIIDSNSSGIAGLSVTALKAAGSSSTITIGTDSSAVATQIQNLVTAYNNVQSYITSNSATSTDSAGKLTAGTLTGDMDAADIAASLRTSAFSPVSITGLSATFSQLAALGIKTNGQNNTVALDSTALNSALASNLSDIKKLFSDSTGGLAAKLDTFVTRLTGDGGTVVTHQAALTKQSSSIDKQIAALEKQIAADSASWTKAFQAMETAQSQLNQQLSYLTKNFS